MKTTLLLIHLLLLLANTFLKQMHWEELAFLGHGLASGHIHPPPTLSLSLSLPSPIPFFLACPFPLSPNLVVYTAWFQLCSIIPLVFCLKHTFIYQKCGKSLQLALRMSKKDTDPTFTEPADQKMTHNILPKKHAHCTM